VGADLFYADERRDGGKDMTKIIVADWNFVNASKFRFLGAEVLSDMYMEQTGLALTQQIFLIQNLEWTNLSWMRSFAVFYSASRKKAEYYLQ
jgi:hypothetical protein